MFRAFIFLTLLKLGDICVYEINAFAYLPLHFVRIFCCFSFTSKTH